MDLTAYRGSPLERRRTADLLALVPPRARTVLDVGARDGFFSTLFADQGREVTALDLERPAIDDARIRCVAGDASALEFADASFDLVFCAEVLEHVPTRLLEKACHELARVSARHLLIGVPYRQDLRYGRTTCGACGKPNPPWGHVNRFDLPRLEALFAGCTVANQSFVGSTHEITNSVSSFLMDLAGNPWGTYSQDEPCVHCGQPIGQPRQRNLLQKAFTKAAFVLTGVQQRMQPPHANWVHLLFEKKPADMTRGQPG